MNRVNTSRWYLLVAFASLLLAGLARAETVNVVGKNDISVDRQNIQDAIDSAPGKKLRVKLRGTFQLDGQRIWVSRSDLMIEGKHQGATLVGVTDQDGIPAPGIESGRAFEVRQQGAGTPITNIRIKGLTLRDFTRVINMVGFSTLDTPAAVSNVVIRDNRLENVDIGFAAHGQVSDVVVENNIIVDALGAGLFLQGLTDAMGPDQKLSNVVVKNNFVSMAPSANPFPLAFQGQGKNVDILLKRNTFQGGVMAVALLGDPTNFRVMENCIKDGGSLGLYGFRSGGINVGLELLGFTGSGYVIERNSYVNNYADFGGIPLEQRDVWFTPISMNNAVTERIGTVVLDDGASNSVVLHGDNPVDYCSIGN